jgi:vacuolar-type H+-ATPase subunit H
MTQTNIERIDPEEALARLLVAEDEARAQLEAAEARAARQVEAARATARAIAEHAEQRIRAASERYLAQHARRLAELREAKRALEVLELQSDARFARLGEAARRLASRLTSGGADDRD